MINVIRITLAFIVFVVGFMCCALMVGEAFFDLIDGWGQRTVFGSISRYILFNAVAGLTAWVSAILARKIANGKEIEL